MFVRDGTQAPNKDLAQNPPRGVLPGGATGVAALGKGQAAGPHMAWRSKAHVAADERQSTAARSRGDIHVKRGGVWWRPLSAHRVACGAYDQAEAVASGAGRYVERWRAMSRCGGGPRARGVTDRAQCQRGRRSVPGRPAPG
ncbi:hypothetical protein GCM10020221_19790 [Streptomyces thioluteus]|uniref:AP2/ERF domain-containing protein n=1 Tax=Streptomyces thioluteus TaxID=66431 RepID=A0ABP6J6W5_STRTU